MRIILRVAAMVVALLACLPFHYLWKLFRRPSPWPRIFLGIVTEAAGMRTRIVGCPLPDQVLFVANHLSWLDIPIIAGATGAGFVSKDDVSDWLVVGWLARLNNTIFVARTKRHTVQGQADTLRSALRRGQAVALFPEGTTGDGVELLPFRASLLASLFPAIPGVKVQPVAIDYGAAAHDIAWVGDESALANAKRMLSRRHPTHVTLHFLEPIDPIAAGDRKALAAQGRDAIARALDASAAPAVRL